MRLFISYRRDDAAAIAGRIYDRLCGAFPSAEVFLDVEGIAPGVDFVERIDQQLERCDALLAVIGPNWSGSPDAEGKRQIHHVDDLLRVELETAVRRNVRIIPILVEGASMLRASELPESLQPLARRQAIELSNKRFRFEVQTLVDALKSVTVR